MVPYRSVNGRRRESREQQVLDAVVSYRFYAPRKLAFDEAHEQMLAEAAWRRHFDGSDPSVTPSRLAERYRHRLGEFLIRVGTNLQGVQPFRPAVPADAGTESVTA